MYLFHFEGEAYLPKTSSTHVQKFKGMLTEQLSSITVHQYFILLVNLPYIPKILTIAQEQDLLSLDLHFLPKINVNMSDFNQLVMFFKCIWSGEAL
jgi:hypothetical protein